jgi:PAS domain S-box-containing protein
MTRHVQSAVLIVVVAVVYFCTGTFGLSLAFIHASASAVWPPSGIALAAVLLWGYRLWPGILLGALGVNFATQGALATALVIAVGNTLEALLGAWLIFRFAEGPKTFARTRNILLFILLAAIVSTTVAPTIGVTGLSLAGHAGWDNYAAIWLTWWLGDMVGTLMVAPLLVLWSTQSFLPVKATQLLEATALLVLLTFVGWILFLHAIPSGLEYFALAPLLWGALRFGRRGAATSAFLMSGIALWGTLHGFGPFAASNLHQSLLLLQIFMATVTVTSLVMASVVGERRRLEQRLLIKDAVSRVLAESPALTEAARKIVKTLCERGGWEVAAIWNVDRSSNQLVCVEIWSLPSVHTPEFAALTRQTKFASGIGLPGRVWSGGEPAWIADIIHDESFVRAPVATKEGLHTAFGFPIKVTNEVVGVIECLSREIREPDDDFLQMVSSIGSQLGQFIERKRAEEARQESESRLQVALAAGQMGTWEWNLSTNRVSWSSTLEEIHGLTPGTFGGRFEDFKKNIHPDDVEKVMAQIEGTLKTAGDYHVAYRMRRPDGTLRWLEAFGEIFPSVDGRPEKLAGVCMDITERKNAEESLRAKENQLRLITDTAPILLLQCDRHGRYRFVNRAYAERLGLAPEQIIGKTLEEVLGQEAYQVIQPHIQTVLEGDLVQYEVEVPYERIGRRFMHAAYVPEKNADGEVAGWVSAISDITERKQAEEMLRQRTRSLEIINDMGNALAGELDLNKVVQMITDAGREISGAEFGAFFYTANHESESPPLCTLSGALREAFEASPLPGNTPLLESAFKGEGVVRIGDALNDPRYGKNPPQHGMSKGCLPARSYLAVPVVSRSGDVLGGLLYGHREPNVFTAESENILTAIASQASVAIDNANLYEAVQRRVEEFQKLIDTAPVGIAVATDAECKHLWGNPEFVRMIGAHTGQNISSDSDNKLRCKIFHDGQEISAEDLPMPRACREGTDVLDQELEIVRDDGVTIHEICRATPLRDEQGNIRGCIGIFLNISDRKQAEAALQQAKNELAAANESLEKRVQERTADLEQARAALLRDMQEQQRLEEQLRQAQKMESIGTLTGGIAHDFNNILNIIRGHASFMGELRSGDQELHRALTIIDEMIDRGTAIVQQLLAIARRSEAKLEKVNLNDLVNRLKPLLSETFPKTIDIGLRLDPSLAPVTADPNQLDQVLLNISLNARDAMPEGGRLLITTGTVSGAELRARFQEVKADYYALVSVVDTGNGMSEAVKSRIFEPFFSTKHQGQGTGLGLSVAYGIVANHGGFIDVTSRLNEGSTFNIYLPIGETKRGRRHREEEFSDTAQKQTEQTILFVEDEVRQLELMQKFLERNGYRVLTAINGLEAVEIHHQYKDEISVVVLDLGLPGLTGWEAFQRMRQANPNLKGVLATGYIAPEIASAAAQGELSAVIMKPYQLSEILEVVSSVALQLQDSEPCPL